ncbi:peroxiredoxin-like family protein [Streptosporangium sp. NPDC023615]|uniref:peroxiredoxin-like family protein n=1 Tax=Streptosporangium sp. NPDC023615 TaxID=3154794 RepID=UPI00343DF341
MRLQPGSVVPLRELPAVTGPAVSLPDRTRLVHLQFRRFAGCPICNLHLRSFVTGNAAIEAAGVREVVVFHSPAEELAGHVTGLPFAVVADPGKRLYAEFGVESAPRSLLDPRVWGAIVRAIARGLWTVARGRERLPARRVHGGRLGLPADFLIAPDGRVIACGYGEHAYDQWSVADVLSLAAREGRRETAP